ncbi:hypothetical protein HBB16_21320 [Pseudonocardia sp. MCCB 268]|nr:hypothetical protein [Pseudonocardia cytotoxica]
MLLATGDVLDVVDTRSPPGLPDAARGRRGRPGGGHAAVGTWWFLMTPRHALRPPSSACTPTSCCTPTASSSRRRPELPDGWVRSGGSRRPASEH